MDNTVGKVTVSIYLDNWSPYHLKHTRSHTSGQFLVKAADVSPKLRGATTGEGRVEGLGFSKEGVVDSGLATINPLLALAELRARVGAEVDEGSRHPDSGKSSRLLNVKDPVHN